MCFVDLSKAFDSISLNKLKAKLHANLPESKLLSLIVKLLNNKTYKILYDGKETKPFRLLNGIPQGDSMSPTLFCLFVNDLFDTLRQNETTTDPIIINDVKITTVIYADDLLLMSQSQDGIIKQTKVIQNYCNENGLKINYDKTKIMINNVNTEYKHHRIHFHGTTSIIEVVRDYKYLGVWISKNNNKHIEHLEKMERNPHL